MAKKTTPAKLGTVYTAPMARIQVIGYDDKWDTLATCIDTPNAVAETVARVRAENAPRISLWVYHPLAGKREYLGQK